VRTEKPAPASSPAPSSAAPRKAEGQTQGSANHRPSRQVAANRPAAATPAPTAPAQGKVGFFRRIGRLFGGN